MMASVRKKAEAERYAVEQESEASKSKAIAESEARAKEIELNGKAKADSIREIGKAEAESKTALAQALKEYGQEAIATLMIEAYPEMIRAVSEPLGNIDKITVVDSGNGKGASSLTNTALNTLTSSQEAFKDAVGLDLASLIESYAGTKNVGGQVRELNSTLKDLGNRESVSSEDSEAVTE